MDGRGSCASISDSSGNLLFYTETYVSLAKTIVWNSMHDTMYNGADSIIGDGLYNELQIIPFPGNNHLFYLFHTGAHTYFDGIYYSLIDMGLDQGRGAVVLKSVTINNNRIADCIQVVKHANGRDWWIISKLSSSPFTSYNRFIVYLISPSGISQEINYDFNDAKDIDFQKIIINPEGSKIMSLRLNGFMCEYDFDRCSGVINNPQVIYPEITTPSLNRLFWEGSYSPDGNLFYVSTSRWTGVDQSYLIQYDLSVNPVSASADTLDSSLAPVGPGAIRLAPDGKIYYSRAYESPGHNSFPYADTMYNYINMNLSVINNPDQPGAACDFQPFSFYLGGKRTYYGLPSNPDYQLGPVIGSACDSLLNSVDDRIVEEIRIEVFPNPFLKTITFQSISQIDGMLKVYNKLGNIVFSKQVSGNQSLDLAFLPSGNYVIEIIGSENVFRKRIVKLD